MIKNLAANVKIVFRCLRYLARIYILKDKEFTAKMLAVTTPATLDQAKNVLQWSGSYSNAHAICSTLDNKEKYRQLKRSINRVKNEYKSRKNSTSPSD